jgi:hypothetical protein
VGRKADYREQVEELLEQLDLLPAGPGKAAVAEEAIRLADVHRDEELGFDAREQSLWSFYDAGRPDLLMVHYAWCLAYLDRNPDDDEDQHDILWAYRWVASSMSAFPQFPRQQIEAAAADMADRYRRAGFSLRPVSVMRRYVAEELGDRAAARKAHDQVGRQPRDWMCDEPHLERSFKAGYQLFAGQLKTALATVEPILLDQFVSHDRAFQCRMHSQFLVPLARVGRVDLARRLQKAAYPLLRANHRYLFVLAWHVEFLAVVGDLPAAVTLAERHLPAAVAAPSQINRFNVTRAARLVIDRLRAAGKHRTKLKLPADLAPGGEPERWGLDALAARLDADLTALAVRFDERNGNTHYADRVSELADLNRLAEGVTDA